MTFPPPAITIPLPLYGDTQVGDFCKIVEILTISGSSSIVEIELPKLMVYLVARKQTFRIEKRMTTPWPTPDLRIQTPVISSMYIV